MAKRKAKKNVKQPSKDAASECTNDDDEQEMGNQRNQFIDNELQRRLAASKAIVDAETEHLLTGLRLLRSNFDNEQLQFPVLRFIEETMPNLVLKLNDENGQFEVEWKDKEKDDNISIGYAGELSMHRSFLQQISRSHPNFSFAGLPTYDGFESSSKAVNPADMEFQFPEFEPSDGQNIMFQNAFHTPGANSQRLSVGATPKTLRVPKPGEMLLSVRGSPLGVYKDDNNMEAIHELEEGQTD